MLKCSLQSSSVSGSVHFPGLSSREPIYFTSHICYSRRIMEKDFTLAPLVDLWDKSRQSGNDVTFPSLSRPISVQHKDTRTEAQTDPHKHSYACTGAHTIIKK